MPGAPRLDRATVLRVKALAEEGYSQREIAKMMGMTASAIAGIIARYREKYGIKLKRPHGGSGRPPETAPVVPDAKKKLDRNKLINIALVAAEQVQKQEPPSKDYWCDFNALCSFNALTKKRCRFPYGNRVPYVFCGAPKAPDVSYCTFHNALCCTPSKPKPFDPYIHKL